MPKYCKEHKVECYEYQRGRVVCPEHDRRILDDEWYFSEEPPQKRYLRVEDIMWDTETRELIFRTENEKGE